MSNLHPNKISEIKQWPPNVPCRSGTGYVNFADKRRFTYHVAAENNSRYQSVGISKAARGVAAGVKIGDACGPGSRWSLQNGGALINFINELNLFAV